MKKFAFSLQKLLNYKQQILDVERAVLNDMNAVLNRMLEELAQMLDERVARMEELRDKMTAGLTAANIESHKNYLSILDFSIRQKELQIEFQRKAVDKQTDKVREAKIEISTMEKLKERKLEDYNYEVNKAEELFIEEFVSNTRAESR